MCNPDVLQFETWDKETVKFWKHDGELNIVINDGCHGAQEFDLSPEQLKKFTEWLKEAE